MMTRQAYGLRAGLFVFALATLVSSNKARLISTGEEVFNRPSERVAVSRVEDAIPKSSGALTMRHQRTQRMSTPAPVPRARSALPSAGYAVIVDGQAKADFETHEQALKAARDLKGRVPMLQIKVYDAEKKSERASRVLIGSAVSVATFQPEPLRLSRGGDTRLAETATKIAHISPYRRIDPSHPGRKRIITLDEWKASGSAQARPGDLQL